MGVADFDGEIAGARMNRWRSALVLTSLSVAAMVAAQPQHAHVHGVAELNVVIDGTMLDVVFESPLDNLLGFEHPPRSDAERKAAGAMATKFRAPLDLFVPTPAARCKAQPVELASPAIDRDLLSSKAPASAIPTASAAPGSGSAASPAAKSPPKGTPAPRPKADSAPGADDGHAELNVHIVFQCDDIAALKGLGGQSLRRIQGRAKNRCAVRGSERSRRRDADHEPPHAGAIADDRLAAHRAADDPIAAHRIPMTTPSPNVLEVRDLAFQWTAEGPRTLEIDRFAMTAGERVFLFGPSGSGKSTLLGLLGGVLVPERGNVRVLDTELPGLSAAARDRFRVDHIGFIFQQFNLIPYLSVLDNVLLPCRFSARRMSRAEAGDGNANKAAVRLLAEVGIDSDLHGRRVTTLSVGQQQRVAAARALIGRPEVIIADEPTSSLDAERQQDFLDLLMRECEASGATLLVREPRPPPRQSVHARSRIDRPASRDDGRDRMTREVRSRRRTCRHDARSATMTPRVPA